MSNSSAQAGHAGLQLLQLVVDVGLVPGLEQGGHSMLHINELVVDPALCGPAWWEGLAGIVT